MPVNRTIRRLRRGRTQYAAAALAMAFGAGAALPAVASASKQQIAIIQDGSDLVNAPAAMAQFRALGATIVRVPVPWALIAPSNTSTKQPRNFNASDPAA
jgi:hypothetical protein